MEMTLLRQRAALFALLLAGSALSACGGGGGGGGGIASTPAPPATPTPTPAPAPAPTPTPTPTNYDTTEYRGSDGPAQHGAIVAYQAGASGKDVTVGVIDSGIATANAEFSGRISRASRDFAGNGSIEDTGGHGTAVTIVLAAARNNSKTLGMAWDATILALRTDTPGSCATESPSDPKSGCQHSTTAITQALDHARVSGARVVNISLGGGAVPSNLAAAVDRATAAGVIIVVASGNDGVAAPDSFATSIVDAGGGRGLVIIAGSVDANGTHSSFSDGALGYEQSTLNALGERVLSQDNKGVQYLYTGTSFSAPQIAGAAALLAQAFPNLTSQQIVSLLLTSANDAGAPGADAVYGRGVLNIARAFAPSGSTNLAGSALSVSLTSNGTLSPAMGDATGTGTSQTIALDSLGRAYSIDIAPTVAAATPSLSLAPALQGRTRSFASSTGPVSIALSIAPGRDGAITSQRLMLSQQDADRAHVLSSAILTRIGPDTTLALGFAQSAASLTARMGDIAQPPFLIANGANTSTGFEGATGTSMALQHRIGARLTLTASAENGRVWQQFDDTLAFERLRNDRQRYASFSVAATRDAGPVQLSTGFTHLRENGTLLGARFAPVIGALAGRSLFLDASARFDAGEGWNVGASYRQGWTQAGSQAHLTTNAWALDAERRSLFRHADRFALRLSQPLRVETGGLRLLLPTAYDYATQSATMGRVDLNLAPTGRQIDQEMVYALPLGSGWLTSNLYRRQQRGNLVWFPDEIGGAMRFNMEF